MKQLLTTAALVFVLSDFMTPAMNGGFSERDGLTGDIDRTMRQATVKTDVQSTELAKRNPAKPEHAEQTGRSCQIIGKEADVSK